MINRQTLHSLVDNIAEDKLDIVAQLLLDYIEEDEEQVTEEDIIAIKQAQEEYARGETISHNDINWD